MKQTINAPPLKPEMELLRQRILQYRIDDPYAALPFSAKLARDNNWNPPFTQRAIAEYLKFIFLCCVSPQGAAPSEAVDEVWHMHLLYTRNYWEDFCRKTIGREVHHQPSAGGPAQRKHYRDAYLETLALYRSVFGADPPPDIWSPDNSPTLTSNVFRPFLNLLSRIFLLLPVLLLSGCNGHLGLLFIPFTCIILIVRYAFKAGSPDAIHRRKDGDSGGSYGGGCGNSCGSSCGGGCGGCGGS